MNLALLDRDSGHLSSAVSALKSEDNTSDKNLKTESYAMDVSDLSAWKKVASESLQLSVVQSTS